MSTPRNDETSESGNGGSKRSDFKSNAPSAPLSAPEVASATTQTAISTTAPQPRWPGHPSGSSAPPPTPAAGLLASTPLIPGPPADNAQQHGFLQLTSSETVPTSSPMLPHGFHYDNPGASRDKQGWPLDGSTIITNSYPLPPTPVISATQKPGVTTDPAKSDTEVSALGTRSVPRTAEERDRFEERAKKAGAMIDQVMAEARAQKRFNQPGGFTNGPRGRASAGRRWQQPGLSPTPIPPFRFRPGPRVASDSQSSSSAVPLPVDRPASTDRVMGSVTHDDLRRMAANLNREEHEQNEQASTAKEAEAERCRKEALRADFEQNYMRYHKDPSLLSALSEEDRAFFTEVETDRILANVDREVQEGKERKLRGDNAECEEDKKRRQAFREQQSQRHVGAEEEVRAAQEMYAQGNTGKNQDKKDDGGDQEGSVS